MYNAITMTAQIQAGHKQQAVSFRIHMRNISYMNSNLAVGAGAGAVLPLLLLLLCPNCPRHSYGATNIRTKQKTR